MGESIVSYIIVGITGILAVFSFVMGIEKMIKIILGNYILSGICLAASHSIDILIKFLNFKPEEKFFGIAYESYAKFFDYGHTTLILLLYVILLVVIYLKSKISIKVPNDNSFEKGMYIILVPLTVISIILTLQIVIMGLSYSPESLAGLADSFGKNGFVYKFVSLTPVWILLHGLATIIITSELKVNVKTDV